MIRVCISIPLGGDRLVETGVEDLLTINRYNSKSFSSLFATARSNKFRSVPLIVTFTKYDQLITSFIFRARKEGRILTRDEQWPYGEEKADAAFEGLCIEPLFATVGKMPFVKVSSERRHSQNNN